MMSLKSYPIGCVGCRYFPLKESLVVGERKQTQEGVSKADQ